MQGRAPPGRNTRWTLARGYHTRVRRVYVSPAPRVVEPAHYFFLFLSGALDATLLLALFSFALHHSLALRGTPTSIAATAAVEDWISPLHGPPV
jgi:hypothetical protein